jgi:hypothetical protein
MKWSSGETQQTTRTYYTSKRQLWDYKHTLARARTHTHVYTHIFHGSEAYQNYNTIYKICKIQSTSVIWALVITDFGYSGLFFHSPTTSLRFTTTTTSVTLVFHISDLWLHHISPTFPNSWFAPATPFLAKESTVHNGYSVFEHWGLTHQSDMKTAYVIW